MNILSTVNRTKLNIQGHHRAELYNLHRKETSSEGGNGNYLW